MISPTIEAFEGARYSIVRVFFAVLNLNVYLPPVALSVVELVHFELYVAFVVLSEKETQSKTLKSIRELCERRLSREQIPVAIQVIDEFPVKPSGKRDMEQLSKIAAEL